MILDLGKKGEIGAKGNRQLRGMVLTGGQSEERKRVGKRKMKISA